MYVYYDLRTHHGVKEIPQIYKYIESLLSLTHVQKGPVTGRNFVMHVKGVWSRSYGKRCQKCTQIDKHCKKRLQPNYKKPLCKVSCLEIRSQLSLACLF